MREFSHLGQVLFMHAIALFHSDEHVLIAVIYLKCIILNLHFVASVDVAWAWTIVDMDSWSSIDAGLLPF